MLRGTNFQLLRACVAWLGVSQREAALELGVSITLLRGVMAGEKCPDSDMAERIVLLSMRWPFGVIHIEDWPKKPPFERRGGVHNPTGKNK